MRIARILTRLNLGGPARQCLASDPLLAERGLTVRVFCGRPEPGEGDLVDALCERGVDVRRIEGLGRSFSPLADLRALGRLRRELQDFEPDVVHTHASKAGSLGRAGFARSGEAAIVHTFHGHVLEGYFSPLLSRALVAHERRLARRSDRILAVSEATGRDLLRLGVVESERLEIVPPGIDLKPLLAIAGQGGCLRRRLGVGERARLIGVVGRLAPVKRPELALAVFARVARHDPRIELVFVGDGALRLDLERRRGALPPDLAARVHLPGAFESMPEVLADLDLVLLTSRSEGLPVALIEAAAAGRAVVACAVGGVGEVVEDGRTGLLASNPGELGPALERMAGDADLRAACGRRARAGCERYSGSALAERLQAVYRAVCEERRCGC